MLKGGMGNLMKQAQKMQEQMQESQAALANAEFTGTSGAGLVQVVMTGRHDVKRVQLDVRRQRNARRSISRGSQ